MSKVKFHLILTEVVLPEHFIFIKLKEILEPKQSEISDFNWDDIKETIETKYFTNYANTERYILGFTIDFSMIGILRKSSINKLILEFGNSFREATIVEGIFRYEDKFVLDEIVELHKEIYEIEMKVREVLTYILANNFPQNNLFDFIKEFEGINFLNDRIKKNKGDYRENLWKEFMENDLFYTSFTHYSYLTKPKQLEPKRIYEIIANSSDFNELKRKTVNKGITDELNPNHKLFVKDLSTKLGAIEIVRNEIMHNRIIKESDTLNLKHRVNYQKTKDELERLINDFWQQEQSKVVTETSKAEYIIKTIIASKTEQDDGSIIFTDIDFEEQTTEDTEDFKTQIYDIINYHTSCDDAEINAIINSNFNE